MNREREIVKASIYGIAGNALLVAFKMAVGFMSHSIAIILDGVNNATDALSSIVTIVGTKLAGRRPDRHHPFGYGRVEYLTSVVIAIIILVAGFISLRESIDKIIHPGTPSYSAITITVIVVAILAKIAIGIMFKRFGDKTNSEALIASGIDSNYDAVLSAGTLVVASEFVQHDVDTTAVGDPIGLVSTVNQVAFPTWQPERCAELLASLGYPAVTGRVSTGDWFAVKGQRAEWIRGTFSPLLTEMEGGAIAQVCLRNGVRFVSVKSVSDHLFSDSQAEEYFDFGQALEALGRAVLPLAKALQKAGR